MSDNKLVIERYLNTEVLDRSNTENIVQNNTTDNFGYTGVVTVKIQCGNKIVSSKTYHNSGTQKLFEFVCGCLGGRFASGAYEANKPCRLVLFTGNRADPVNDENDAARYWDGYALNNPIYLSSEPVPRKVYEVDAKGNEVENKKAYSVTYTFKIPYALLKTTENTNVFIYKAALYNNSSFGYSDRYAYYKFTESVNGSTAWSPIEIIIANKSSNNFSIVVEWKMTFKNN